MGPVFKYCQIGADFHRNLAESVFSGRSAVLLSIRGLGKRYVLKRLGDALRREGSRLVVEVEFPHEQALLAPADVQKLVEAAVCKAAPNGNYNEMASHDDLLNSVKHLCKQRFRVVLLASNLDSLAHHLAQSFLREVRVLVSHHESPLTAVLTGEENLRELVHGAESEFNCPHQFILQGFDEPEFLAYMQKRLETARISFADQNACLRLLFEQTNGNVHLARAALWAWVETRSRAFRQNDVPATTDEFSDFVQKFPVSEACGVDVFFRCTQVISGGPEAWNDLENLRQGRPVSANETGPPHVLELAGLVIRKNGELRYASPIMKEFAQRYYDEKRLGDLHAVSGDWKNAFRFYVQMTEAQRVRPGGASDMPQLALVIKAFIAELHKLATRLGMAEGETTLRELESFFSRGCKALLGVSDVTFWRFSDRWHPWPDQYIDPSVLDEARVFLEGADRLPGGWRVGSEPMIKCDKRGLFAILPSVVPNWRSAVVVSEARHAIAISRERREFLQELLIQFANAYNYTIVNWKVNTRLQARGRHLEVATKIVTALGESIRNPYDAIKQAGEGLLALGYRRVMFALVNRAQNRIRGIGDFICDDASPDLADATNWSLSDPQSDIQPWVVKNQKVCIVDDWRTWTGRKKTPPINVELCRRAQTQTAFAVVPMILRVRTTSEEWIERVFGTMHVERKDGLPPSDEEVDDLVEFGRQMAAATQQSEHTHALLHALQAEEDEVTILDPERNVRFANTASAKRYNLLEGWHDSTKRVRLGSSLHVDVGRDIKLVLERGGSKVRHIGSADRDDPLHEAILCAALPDWRQPVVKTRPSNDNPPIGVIIQTRNLSPLEKICSALKDVARCAVDRDTTVPALLKSVEALGYKSGRLYLVAPNCPDNLVSADSFGLEFDYAKRFRNGEYAFSRSDIAHNETWGSLVKGKPRLYRWTPGSKQGPGSPTKHGLHVFDVEHPALDNAWKRPGDYWLDLPLLSNNRVIGKLTIDCGHNGECDLKPVMFELLGIFAVLLGTLIDALDQKERWVREASERAMADTAHKIGTKLAGLSGFAEDYRRAAPGNVQVEAINRWMEPTVNDCFAHLKQVKENFIGKMALTRTRTLIRPILEGASESILGHYCRNGRAACRIFCVDDLRFNLDPTRFKNALEAMLDNSRAMTSPQRKLEVGLHAAVFTQGKKSWLRLAVVDNGPGIPPGERERIFESFYSRRPGGLPSTGLGLSFVQRVMAAHGGTVLAVEPAEPGAKFIIEIPEQA